MSMAFRVAVVVGSLRKESWTRAVARALVAVAPPLLVFEWFDIGALPHYNADLEPSPPPAWVAFRAQSRSVDAVLFVTPEYNRSVPGVLKNAIDVASRPSGQGVWNGKPAAVVSVAPGALGGFGANHHLRQALVFLNMPTMAQPEAYIGGVATLLDHDGNVTNEATTAFLTRFMTAFAAWIEQQQP